MTKETIDITPIVIRIGVAVALSFAGFVLSRLIDRKNSSAQPPKSEPPKDCPREAEITRLKRIIKTLEERESNLELQLFELYGLREQYIIFQETQNRLKITATESKLLYLKLHSLQEENRNLLKELENAKHQIKLLKEKLTKEARENRDQIIALKGKVSKLVGEESSEEKVRREKDELVKKVEELEAVKCADAEELVHLRWVNACLRYELHKARDQSKSCEETPKQLMMDNEEEREIEWPSSGGSFSTNSGEMEGASLSRKSSRDSIRRR